MSPFRRPTWYDRAVGAYVVLWVLIELAQLSGVRAMYGPANWLYFVLGGIATHAMWRAGSASRDQRTRLAWRVQAGASALLVVNGALWTAWLVLYPKAPEPEWHNWVTFAVQPIAALGFLLLPEGRKLSFRERRVLLDLALMFFGALALAWYLSIRTTLQSATAGTVEAYSIALGIGFWAVVLSAGQAYVRTPDSVTRHAVAFMIAAQVMFITADYSYSKDVTLYAPGAIQDLLYFSAWVFRWLAARRAWRGASEPRRAVERGFQSGTAPTAFVAGAFVLLLYANYADTDASPRDRLLVALIVSTMTWLLVARHVAELRESRRELGEIDAQKERFQRVIEHSTDVIVVTTGGRVVVWNNMTAHLQFGLEAGQRLDALVHPDDLAALAEWLPSGGETVRTTSIGVRLRRPDGSWEQMELRAQDRRGDPRISGIVVNGRNRSAELALEGRVRHAEKLATLHEMAGRIAHAFNNGLAVVQGHAELLADAAGAESEWAGDVGEIRAAAAKGAAITRQLLGFSGRKVVQPETLDASSVVEEMLPIWRRLMPSGITVRAEGSAGAAQVHIDRAQFEQVLFNLVVNARDAMPNGGEIVVTVQTADADPESSLGVRRVSVAVRDAGIGMSPDEQARIFEPFYTTKSPGQGTGLGLAMVDTIVRRAGGEIQVQSAPGEGTSVAVLLPAVRTPGRASRPVRAVMEALETEHEAAKAPEARIRVVLVDDEEAVRRVTQRLLQRAGFEVLAFSGGPEALAQLSVHGGSCDVLVTDMMMPGMSGRELIERVVQVRPTLPILCITGFTADSDARAPLASQVVGVLEKPFEAAALVSAVRQAAALRDV